jgi:ATP-dependent 26S proteasome regulatory subunit
MDETAEAVSRGGGGEVAAEVTTVDSLATHEQSYAGLLPLLSRLDERLAAAVAAANRVFAARAAGDLYRGLAISPADVVAALGRVPGEPFLPFGALAAVEAGGSLSVRRLLWLQRVYSLTDFDLNVILVALAPEIDLRYERMYAYLHDDVTRRHPSVDLALNVLCASPGEKLQQRGRFAPDAPLVRNRLIEIYADPHHANAPLLSRHYRLDEQIVRVLLLDDSLDSRLTGSCEMASPSEGAPLDEAMRQTLHQLASSHAQAPLRVYFHGPAHCGQTEAAALLAEALDLRVLNADLRGLGTDSGIAGALPVLVREAWFRGALLHVRSLDASNESSANALWRALKDLPVHCVIEGKEVWKPAADKPPGVMTIEFAYPNLAQRAQWWRQCLERHELEPDEETLTTLSQRYRLTYSQIRDAAAVAASSAVDFQTPIVFAAARAQGGYDLAALVHKITPVRTWDDIVLPDDTLTQLRELRQWVVHRHHVLDRWGFDRKLSFGKGVTALFGGPSGTGKTMAAEIVANDLRLDLYKIDLSGIVSKYIGETEKNLDRIFTTAENANAILFFDEADALFGKRSEVRDSHDRYANLEISYLLQKMEEFDGIAILATNLRQNLDDAFVRRMAFMIHFPFPDETSRRRIWAGIWPRATPLAADVDLDFLARQFRLTGGNIKNIALAAAFLAAADGGGVTMAHLHHAVRREYQKLGKTLTLDDLRAGSSLPGAAP